MRGVVSVFTTASAYIDGAQQQQGRTQAQGVNGTQNEGHQEELDALWLG